MTGSKYYSIEVLIKEKRTITSTLSKLTRIRERRTTTANEKKKKKETEIYNDLPYLFMHITDVKTLYRF